MYIWEFYEGYPNKSVGQYDEKNQIDRFFFTGVEKLLDNEEIIILFEIKKEEILKYDDIENTGGGWLKIVSPDLATTLKQYAPQEVQLVDVTLRTQNGDIKDYKIVNILREVSALNKEESKFSYIPGSNEQAIMGFRKLRLHPQDDFNIALLSEYKPFILISPFLKEKIEKFNGVAIFKDEELVL